jgi:alkylated DNA repair dioxygenase AlkB
METYGDAPVRYIPGFLAAPRAEAFFQTLRAEMPWERGVFRSYGKIIPVPRLVTWIADRPYTYSGQTYQPHSWTPALREIKEKVEQVAASAFNSVLLNLYENGSHSVGWHADDEPEMSHDHPIASVSLGAIRTFHLRKGKGPIQYIELEHGSLLIMAAGMQREWRHQLPKTRKPCRPRINLTFRCLTDQSGPTLVTGNSTGPIGQPSEFSTPVRR